MELEIEEHLFLPLLQPCDDTSAKRIEELHAHLVVTDAVAKTRDKLLCRCTRRHIERRNQPIICHNLTPL